MSLYGTLRSLAIRATRRVQVKFEDPWSVNAMGKRIRVLPRESAASVRCGWGCAMMQIALAPPCLFYIYCTVCVPAL